jgi:hypothetical protein
MYLNEEERVLVICALTKILESEPPYTRVDEYKKLLDRLRQLNQQDEEAEQAEEMSYELDEI